jgi:hypothetical protein
VAREFKPLGDGAAKTPATKRAVAVKNFILKEIKVLSIRYLAKNAIKYEDEY